MRKGRKTERGLNKKRGEGRGCDGDRRKEGKHDERRGG